MQEFYLLHLRIARILSQEIQVNRLQLSIRLMILMQLLSLILIVGISHTVIWLHD